jgi:hypothetical protein
LERLAGTLSVTGVPHNIDELSDYRFRLQLPVRHRTSPSGIPGNGALGGALYSARQARYLNILTD